MFIEDLKTIADNKLPALVQPKPINPNFISLAELLERIQAAPAKRLPLPSAAELMMIWGTAQGDKPLWRCNSHTRGIVLADATQALRATDRLGYVSRLGNFERDDAMGASIDYELFGFDRQEYSDFLTLKAGEPLDLFCPMPEPQADTAQQQPAATPAPVVAARDGRTKPRANKSQKTLIFEAKVLELMDKFWNARKLGTEPNKGDLHTLVYNEMLRGSIRGASTKLNIGLVRDAAKPWKAPTVLPTFVPDSKFADKRHPFKADM